MKLYVCWTKRELHIRSSGHPCANAHKALTEAGYDPEVVHALSFGALPDALQTPARKLVKEKTGQNWVPALETDDGQWIGGSEAIVTWAEANPA
ncbi:MAG TPA: glutathione S-transferase N-terminal domain-containing protein [Solirubrobacterales bacterium]